MNEHALLDSEVQLRNINACVIMHRLTEQIRVPEEGKEALIMHSRTSSADLLVWRLVHKKSCQD